MKNRAPSGRLPRPGELPNSSSDVYSLGVIMAQMCKHANNYLAPPIRDLLQGEKSKNNPSGRRIFSSYYSLRLKELIRKCRSRNPLERPPIYDLYLETKSWMETFRGHAYWEEQESRACVVAGIAIYHNKVLYTKDEQNLFDANMEFRNAYEAANVEPVFEAEDIDVFGSKEVKRKYEKILNTVDDSIITAIPLIPDSGLSPTPSDPKPEEYEEHIPEPPPATVADQPQFHPEPPKDNIEADVGAPRGVEEVAMVPKNPNHAPSKTLSVPKSPSPRGTCSSSCRRKRIRGAMNVEQILNVAAEEE